MLALVIAVVLADVAWLCFAAGVGSNNMLFQRATSGFGLGASVAPNWSFHSVDPRLDAYCENELWPIPGATCFNPHHGATAADFPPLDAKLSGSLASHEPQSAAH